MTPQQIEAMKLALEALEENHHLIEEHERSEYLVRYDKIISLLAKALAQPEPEPHGWYIDGYGAVIGTAEPKSVRVGEWLPWYTALPQRTWVGLTEQEHTDIAVECGCMSADWVFYGAAVERKLKERNT